MKKMKRVKKFKPCTCGVCLDCLLNRPLHERLGLPPDPPCTMRFDYLPSPAGRQLTVSEFAEKLRAHPETIRRHIRAGKIQVARIGGIIRIDESEILRLTQPPLSAALQRKC